MHVDLGVSMLAIEKFEEKCDVVGPGRAQPEIIHRRDLFLERSAQVFVFESSGTAELNDAGVQRAFLLFVLDLLLGLVFFFASRLADRRLAESGGSETGEEGE